MNKNDAAEKADVSGASSRRTALKVGVGAGVGLVAWSGPTITSLGGTPAYAQGCTFVINIDLAGGCRNTTNLSGCDFGFQPLEPVLPPGFSIAPQIPNNNCCADNFQSTFTFPEGLTCTVRIVFRAPPQCSGPIIGSLVFGPKSDGSLTVTFGCLPADPPSNTQYTITATCVTTGAPAACLN